MLRTPGGERSPVSGRCVDEGTRSRLASSFSLGFGQTGGGERPRPLPSPMPGVPCEAL